MKSNQDNIVLTDSLLAGFTAIPQQPLSLPPIVDQEERRLRRLNLIRILDEACELVDDVLAEQPKLPVQVRDRPRTGPSRQ